MNDDESGRRLYQYSLWSLLVVVTVASVLCSIAICCTDWSAPITVFAGLCISSVGFGPLSQRRHPMAGIGHAIAGFLIRLAGLAIVAFGLYLFAVQVGWRMHHHL